MNILLLNHYAGSMKYGMEFRPYTFAREWVKAGHAVRIVAASFSHLRQRQPEIAGVITREEIDGISYCWIKTPAYAGNTVLRAINIFIFILRLQLHRKAILKNFNPDIVIGSSTYPLDNVIGHLIARRYRAIHVYEVHDLWPMSLIDLGGMSPRHPFVLLMKWAERYAYKTADIVISLLPFAERYMRGQGLGEDKFFCVPNGVDLLEAGETGSGELPELHTSLLGRLKDDHAFIVGYAGGHAISNALTSFVASAIYLRRRNAALVLVGNGAEKNRLEQLVQRLKLTNVYFLPSVPRMVVQQLLSYMDALFIGWQNKPIYRYGVSPNKLMDYMLSGKPIIHANSMGNDIVAACHCGISVPAEDAEAIAGAVVKLMEMDDDERQRVGQRGRRLIQQHYQNKDLAMKFIESCARTVTARPSFNIYEMRKDHVYQLR